MFFSRLVALREKYFFHLCEYSWPDCDPGTRAGNNDGQDYQGGGFLAV